MSLPRVVIVALHFARLASPTYAITSLVRSREQYGDVTETGAEPSLLSLEDSDVVALTSAFEGAHAVLFAAGAGGKGGPERTKAVDFEGAVKVFDAIEAVQGEKPRLLLVGAIDTRDMSKPAPAHYTAEDIAASQKSHAAIGNYYDWKLEADRNLHARTVFQWTILRPGELLDSPGTGKVSVGSTHMGSVPRADVAAVLLALLNEPNGASIALDLISGDTPIEEAVRQAIAKGVSDYHD